MKLSEWELKLKVMDDVYNHVFCGEDRDPMETNYYRGSKDFMNEYFWISEIVIKYLKEIKEGKLELSGN